MIHVPGCALRDFTYEIGSGEEFPDCTCHMFGTLTFNYYSGDRTQAFIEHFDLNFALGNVIKYVVRAGRKTPDAKADLEKALWYLQREIDRNDAHP